MKIIQLIEKLEKLTNKKVVLEDITIPINKGDTILTGKFRNKKVVVKDIDKDEYDSPTVNGKSILKIRMTPKKENN